MGQPKKVLQICNYFLGTKLFNTLFRELNEQGVECHTYCPASKSTFVGWDVEHEKTERVTVSRCFTQADRLFFHRKSRKVFRDLEQHYSLGEFDAIYAHSVFSGGYAAWKAGEKYGVPYMVAVCNTDVNTFFHYGFWLRPMGVKIMLNAKRIVFVTEAYRDFVREHYIPERDKACFTEKSVVLPFGIDKEWLEHKQVHTRLPGEKTVRLVSTGRIEPNKNQLTTVKACELLRKAGLQPELKLIGRVTEEKYLEKLLAYDFVSYLGEKSFSEIREIYRECDCFVMPSVHETFGLVYGEAMSQGLPIVYSRGQGFDRQFPEGEAGFRADSDSPESVKDAILKILADYNDMSVRVSRLSEQLNWTSIAQRYYNVFEEMSKRDG